MTFIMRVVYETKNFFGDRELQDITSPATFADMKKGFALLKRQPNTALWFAFNGDWHGYMYDSLADSKAEKLAVRSGNGDVQYRPLSEVKAELYKRFRNC